MNASSESGLWAMETSTGTPASGRVVGSEGSVLTVVRILSGEKAAVPTVQSGSAVPEAEISGCHSGRRRNLERIAGEERKNSHGQG